MFKNYITIREATERLGVSIDTLRRWDESGRLKSTRFTPSGHRYYQSDDINLLVSDLFALAKKWITDTDPKNPDDEFYCPDASIFQARLGKLEKEIQLIPDLKKDFSLITSIVGEIGNNSFDHNVGSWPDIMGIIFAYDLNKRQIVLADRGQGILTTLRRVKPELSNDEDALSVAFTEKISGRAPESRGNGLKYVKLVITNKDNTIPLELYYQTGQATLDLKGGDSKLKISESDFSFRGCFAFITF